MRPFRFIFFFLFITLSFGLLSAQVETEEKTSLEQKLKKLFPDSEITEMKSKDFYTGSYQMVLNEPLDHQNPKSGTFKHYVYFSHIGFKKPTVLVTEGYNARPRTYELSKILKGNQVQVEYRFYGKSRPDTIPWQYLNNDQAIEDYHALITKLKTVYTGKWISTGISKGGETVLIYKSKYPKEVDAAVPYVAPIINGQEDPRTEAHIKSIGTNKCRGSIFKFQRKVLNNRDSVIYQINKYAEKKNMKFTEIPVEEALEYAVMEFPFSFWQWGGNCGEIPGENAAAKEMFDYINKIVGIGFYNDKTYYDLLPSYYQHMTELGYYGFDPTSVRDLLEVAHEPTNLRFSPKNVDLTYDPDYMSKVRNYIENNGDKILYIYGGYDTWGACAPNPKPNVDALKMVLEKGSHKTRIKDFSKEDQQKIYDKLKQWFGNDVTIYPIEN